MSIRKRELKSGICYQVLYRDPTGRQRSKQFATRREAVAFEAAESTRIRRGEWTDPRLNEIKFGDWATDWLASDPGKRLSTQSRDEIVVRLHLMPSLKNRLISQITPMDVQKLVNVWTTQSAPGTVLRHYRTLAAIMRSAVNCDLILKSPCRAIKLPKKTTKEVRVIDGDELQKLADEMGPFSAMAYIGAVLGLRWGEVAGLRVKDLDLLNRKLQIVQQVSRGKSGQPIISPPKTNTAIRTLTMPPELASAIALRLRQSELTVNDQESLVFSTEVGGPLAYSNWRRRIWVPACERADLVGLGFHDLRRTNATAMVASGVDIKTAQRRLGHADPRMTLAIYAQGTEDGDSAAADRLGKTFMSKNVDTMLTDEAEDHHEHLGSLPLTRENKRGRNRTRTCDLCRVKAAR